LSRRKTYALTGKDKQVLAAQIQRLEVIAGNGRRIKDLIAK